MSKREFEKFSATSIDLNDITEALEQLPPEDLQTLREIFTIISQPKANHQENQRRLEQIAEGVIATSSPVAYFLLPFIKKARDMSPLKNITYVDHLDFFKEIFDPRGIMDPKKGKPLSLHQILSASKKLGRKMRGK